MPDVSTGTHPLALAGSEWTPFLALDRLNSWARASVPRWSVLPSALRPLVYWTKTQAILDATRRWHVGMRRIMVRKPCRNCGGTGVWVSPNWYSTYGGGDGGEPCRNCRATGTVSLKFVETVIGPVRWHTPHDRWAACGLDVRVPFPCFYGHHGDEYYALADDGWEPNRPGRPLTIDEVERDMMIVLREWPQHFCFIIDSRYHAGLMQRHGLPDVPRAEKWLLDLTDRNRARERLEQILLDAIDEGHAHAA